MFFTSANLNCQSPVSPVEQLLPSWYSTVIIVETDPSSLDVFTTDQRITVNISHRTITIATSVHKKNFTGRMEEKGGRREEDNCDLFDSIWNFYGWLVLPRCTSL